jgi:hypothetical protein
LFRFIALAMLCFEVVHLNARSCTWVLVAQPCLVLEEWGVRDQFVEGAIHALTANDVQRWEFGKDLLQDLSNVEDVGGGHLEVPVSSRISCGALGIGTGEGIFKAVVDVFELSGQSWLLWSMDVALQLWAVSGLQKEQLQASARHSRARPSRGCCLYRTLVLLLHLKIAWNNM